MFPARKSEEKKHPKDLDVGGRTKSILRTSKSAQTPLTTLSPLCLDNPNAIFLLLNFRKILDTLRIWDPIPPCFIALMFYKPIPVSARSKAWVCGSSLSGTAGSNPSGAIDVCLL